jgi:GxxExxY protein
MYKLFASADELSRTAIGAAIEGHRTMGPGLLESIYEKCLIHELGLRGVRVTRQQSVSVCYKDLTFEDALRFDILLEDCLLMEIQAVEQILPIHKAQVVSYLNLLNLPLGLRINGHELRLSDGLHRQFLSRVNRDDGVRQNLKQKDTKK